MCVSIGGLEVRHCRRQYRLSVPSSAAKVCRKQQAWKLQSYATHKLAVGDNTVQFVVDVS